MFFFKLKNVRANGRLYSERAIQTQGLNDTVGVVVRNGPHYFPGKQSALWSRPTSL